MHLCHRIPSIPFGLACSGGIDSMVVLDFLHRFPRNSFTLLYFNHETEHGKAAEEFLVRRSKELNIPLEIGRITRERLPKESLEVYWREQRYSFFNLFDFPIITCHHLNDAVETWIFSSLRGHSKLIPIENGKFIRPFLLVSKREIESWQQKYHVEYIQDESNFEEEHARNIIRNSMMKDVLRVNPGILKTIKKKYLVGL